MPLKFITDMKWSSSFLILLSKPWCVSAPLQMWRVWWTVLFLCSWSWRQRNRRLSSKVFVRNWWSSEKERGPHSECSCESSRVVFGLGEWIHSSVLLQCQIKNKLVFVLSFASFWIYRLSNLFHGMDENTPVRYTVYCSLIKVAATCNAISFIPTDLDQVQQFIPETLPTKASKA